MSFIQDNQLIEALLTNRSYPTFSKGVGIRRTKGREQNVNPFRPKNPVKCRGKLAIPIMNQKADGGFPIRKRPDPLACLLGHPG